jgi:hypothetical protein
LGNDISFGIVDFGFDLDFFFFIYKLFTVDFESIVCTLSCLGLEVGQGICFHLYPLPICKAKLLQFMYYFKFVFNLLIGLQILCDSSVKFFFFLIKNYRIWFIKIKRVIHD